MCVGKGSRQLVATVGFSASCLAVTLLALCKRTRNIISMTQQLFTIKHTYYILTADIKYCGMYCPQENTIYHSLLLQNFSTTIIF